MDVSKRKSVLTTYTFFIVFIFCIVPQESIQDSDSIYSWIFDDHQSDFLAKWKHIIVTIYGGNSLRELIEMCPRGCQSPRCNSFPVHAVIPAGPQICIPDHIRILRKAQQIAKDWEHLIQISHDMLLFRGISEMIILFLIIVLILRGHYRFKDLWYLPSTRQWQLELDPTWGLPGKVWSLLRIKVVKGKNKEPTDRKYLSYTDNPTIMGPKFWFYKHVIRDMYKRHKYYKRNRYFHKLAWQITKLGRLVPETLRRHQKLQRRAGEMDEARSPEVEPDPVALLPWEIDLAEELNQVHLRRAKEALKRQVEKDKIEGQYVCGRYPIGHRKQQEALRHHHHHHHHHHRRRNSEPDVLVPLGKEELEYLAKEMEGNPNADYVMVDGQMRLHPTTRKHHHHHHHHRQGGKKEKKEKKDKEADEKQADVKEKESSKKTDSKKTDSSKKNDSANAKKNESSSSKKKL